MEVSPPGAVQALNFLDDKVTLVWESAPTSGSDTFNLYRGDLIDLGTNYGSCLEQGIPTNTTTDATAPPTGSGWFYLVTAVNAEGEGTMGFDTDPTERVNSAPCL